MKCPKHCATCRVFRDGKCELDLYNSIPQEEKRKEVQVSSPGWIELVTPVMFQRWPDVFRMKIRKQQPLRWLAHEFDHRISRARSPEVMGNWKSLPSSMDRMMEESADFFVIDTDDEVSGPSRIQRVLKKREEERLSHPVQDLDEPDEPNESEDVMDVGVLETYFDSQDDYEDDREGEEDSGFSLLDKPLSLPSRTFDLTFYVERRLVPVDVSTGRILKFKDPQQERNYVEAGLAQYQLRSFERSTPLYFMPKFRNLRPNGKILGLVKDIRKGKVKTPMEMFKRCQALRISNKKPYRRKNGKPFTREMIKRVRERVKEDPDYKPEIQVFMTYRRLWDFFHRVMAKKNPVDYQSWISRKIARAKAKKARPVQPEAREFSCPDDPDLVYGPLADFYAESSIPDEEAVL